MSFGTRCTLHFGMADASETDALDFETTEQNFKSNNISAITNTLSGNYSLVPSYLHIDSDPHPANVGYTVHVNNFPHHRRIYVWTEERTSVAWICESAFLQLPDTNRINRQIDYQHIYFTNISINNQRFPYSRSSRLGYIFLDSLLCYLSCNLLAHCTAFWIFLFWTW